MINRKLIRKTLREVGAKADVDFLRKVRNHVYKRISDGETWCHICTSADRVGGWDSTQSNEVRNIMSRLISKHSDGDTIERIGKFFDNDYWNKSNFKGGMYSADRIRKVVLQEMIDMNRNRKGNRAKPTKE